LVLLRTVIGAVILVPVAAARGNLRPLLPYWRPFLLYTLAEVAAPWILLSDAERRLTSSLTGLLIATVPLVGAGLAIVSGDQDRLDARRMTGLVVGFLGVATLLGFNVSRGDLPSAGEVVLVAVGYAIGPRIVARQLPQAPAVGVVAASLLLTALIYAPFGLAQFPAHPTAQALLAVAILGAVCTALAFVVFFALIAEVGPVRATVITYVNPVVALVLGVVLLREPLTLSALVGFGLILLGMLLSTQRRSQPGEPVLNDSAYTTSTAAPVMSPERSEDRA
jgi:drug/metabolite transporter (DMT)-like permease